VSTRHQRARARAPVRLVSSVRVEPRGIHEHVSVWVQGALAGTLIVGPGQGELLRSLLLVGHRDPKPEGDA
jgi:hypothetical protein